MKPKLIIASFMAMSALAQAAVTLQFSSTTNYLSNFANASGTSIASDGSNRMVWGLIVDTAGDGFDGASETNPYLHGFSMAGNTTGITLSTTTNGGVSSVLTDDVLFIAASVMASSTSLTPPDGSLTNMNRILSFTAMNYGSGVVEGKSYAVVWFDQLALGGISTEGQKYGVFNTGLTLPADPGTYNISANFAGADTLKPMNYALTVIPEPSAALLGALGALGLLRRRRI